MTETKVKGLDVSSCFLHIFAMICMLCDHTWSTLLPNWEWLTCIGRMAFPIFAFMMAEGFFHTRSVKKYMLRLLIFAVISEIPFDLMYDGVWFYPYHQNVMWTFLIALSGMELMEKIRKKGKIWLTILLDFLVVIFTGLLAQILGTDYYATGVWMVYIFYFFYRSRFSPRFRWLCYAGQFVLMWYLNIEILGGYYYPIHIFGMEIELVQQSIAMLSLIPIWLYQGRQGYHARWFQYFCYGFYPGHILILWLIGFLSMKLF